MTASQAAAPPRNHLLASLPPDCLQRLRPRLVPVTLPLRQELFAPEQTIEAVHFPESGLISLVAWLEDGMQAEVGIIGREGMLGLSLLSGETAAFCQAIVQMAGAGFRMTASDFRHEFDNNPPFRTMLLRYNEALQAQVMQTAACNGRHDLEQRLARWLLMAHDRAEDDLLPLTQDFMAMMLGVHRPSITVTAGILQRAGLIRYANGQVRVLDRAALEAASCECYRTVRRRFTVLLGELKT